MCVHNVRGCVVLIIVADSQDSGQKSSSADNEDRLIFSRMVRDGKKYAGEGRKVFSLFLYVFVCICVCSRVSVCLSVLSV